MKHEEVMVALIVKLYLMTCFYLFKSRIYNTIDAGC